MKNKFTLTVVFLLAMIPVLFGQEILTLRGRVVDENGLGIPSVNISVSNSSNGGMTDFDGYFKVMLSELPAQLEFQAVGYEVALKKIKPDAADKKLTVTLRQDFLGLDQVVISGTRSRITRNKAPVLVKALDPKLFQAVNALSVSESLNFSPGVRLETNCQNCNTTAVRINGLQGSYSQILIDSRPIFSALLGVYGLEILPTTMIDRIEVVRGGGSALYGASAVAGTINIITKDPVLNSWEISSNLGLLGGESADKSLGFNTSVVSDDLNSGVTAYGLFRDRAGYDANGDGFTEKAALRSNIFGLTAFLKPSLTSKIHLDVMSINSFRRGGDRLNLPPQFTDITEQLEHNTIMGGVTYEGHSADLSNRYSVYLAVQHTDRKSYYGGLFGGRTRADSVEANKAFGNTDNLNIVMGTKYIYEFDSRHKITTGLEYSHENVDFQTPGYDKINTQKINTVGAYGQFSWKAFDGFTALLGARLDYVDVDGFYAIGEVKAQADEAVTVLSPRVSLMYQLNDFWKFRAGYARGFRPPRAYDEDFEVSTAAGRQSFTMISDDLKTEYSHAFTASLNFTKAFQEIQTNFLIAGFYTTINRPFTLINAGSLPQGKLLNEIRNGVGSYVTGVNVDFGASFSPRFTAQIGGTFQKSAYKGEQLIYDAMPSFPLDHDVSVSEYVRSPNFYGYFSLYTEPLKTLHFDITGTYTGEMTVPHVVRESGMIDLVNTTPFVDINLQFSRDFQLSDKVGITLNAGVNNVFNSYQKDFDKGPTRDSDYIYGPASPRTYFIGLSLKSL